MAEHFRDEQNQDVLRRASVRAGVLVDILAQPGLVL